jgi:hypothetical protein
MPSLLEGRISHLEVNAEVPAHGRNTIYTRDQLALTGLEGNLTV